MNKKMKLLLPLFLLSQGTMAFAPPKVATSVSHLHSTPTLEAPPETNGASSEITDLAAVSPKPDPMETPPTPDPVDSTKPIYVSEDDRFKCDGNVEMWRNIVSRGNDQDLRDLLEVLRAGLFSLSSQSRGYWSSCGARTVFFGANGLLSTVIANNESGNGMRAAVANVFRVLEVVKCYEQEFKAIEDGLLKYPWDFPVQANNRVQFGHRQTNPLFALSESLTLLGEAPAILDRRTRFQGKPSGQVWMSKAQQKSSVQYPGYYLNDFHYQTDGWLSSSSAKKYEMSSETIFVGSQDVMQRQTIIPLRKHFAKNAPANLLEVACGTGRLSTFVRDNFPTTDVTLTDLSPFYLEKAKENDDYWRSYRGKEAMRESTGISKDPKPVQLVQAQAEDLPFPDNSFEAVTCVYLFHELPGPIRAKAVKEMARIVKPGGMVVFSDSVQVGDRSALPNLEDFSKFNEPHYSDYVRTCDVGKLFENEGMMCGEKYVSSRTKTLSFIKPMEN